MKPKLLGRLAATSVLLLSAATATAHDFEVYGIYYNINDDGTTVSVTYKGSSYYANEYSGAVTVPSKVTYGGTTYSVTSIGKSAFNSCSGLTAVEIPNSVTSIGEYAFAWCSGLTAVEIPNSVTSIGSYAFYGCSGLTRVDINDIEAWCNITFGSDESNPLNYAHRLYLNGTEITHFIIPNTTTKINDYAFTGGSGLTAIEIPNSVTSIGNYAFQDCSGLTSLEIPNYVTSIGYSAFNGCSGLNTIKVQSGNQKYDSRDNCNAIIKTATNTLLTGCKSTLIPNTVTSIDGLAFAGCSGLTAIEIPNSVTTIGGWAFAGCSSLTAVEIPISVTSIGYGAFNGCSGLNTITVQSGNQTYDSRDNCNAINETATNILHTGCKSTLIPNTVTSIGDLAFAGCSSLTAIEIPNSVTTIGWVAFWGCSGLEVVEIPNSVTSIGEDAFYSCSGLTVVSIGNSVTTIGDGAFSFCDNLELVFFNARNCTASSSIFDSDKEITFVIGAEVEQIGDNVLKPHSYFESSSYTQKIVSHATIPPVITSNTFATTYCPLYVPKDSYAKYWAADVWREFSDMRQIENSVTKIELNKDDMNIVTNNSEQLRATITPSNATLKEIFWSSDNPDIASVDQSGKVKGLKSGMATISVIAIGGSSVKASCRVSVGEFISESLTLDPSELKLAINQSAQIRPVAMPNNISNTSFEWTTSDANVVVFRKNPNGSITVLGAADGVATITCRTTDGSNLTATCVVTVGTGAVDGIEADAAKVRGENGVIRIEGAEGAQVEVFNAAGVCIFSGVATEIPVAQRGIYVVKVGGRATKIAL